MGFWNVTGKIAKGALKVTGYIANEAVKQTTGIDVAQEIKPAVESYKEGSMIEKEKKALEKNREAYIREYGEEAYYEELEYLQMELKFAVEEFKYTKSYVKEALLEKGEQFEKKEKILEMQEKIESLSDKQILANLKRDNVPEGVRYLLERERSSRGI